MNVRVEVKIVDPGQTEEVEVMAVSVELGQTVAEGDPLLELATDKANVDLEAPQDGVVQEILVSEGDIVPVDRVFVVLEAT
jgi:pyruvate/2-oxoglutarate dehydrogenase complex dihydrolipoamide acyltransferase (E2) component